MEVYKILKTDEGKEDSVKRTSKPQFLLTMPLT